MSGIYTDHNPLVFLHRMYNQNQRLMRWALIVQGYNLVIHHKKGSENVCADVLSSVMLLCSHQAFIVCTRFPVVTHSVVCLDIYLYGAWDAIGV